MGQRRRADSVTVADGAGTGFSSPGQRPEPLSERGTSGCGGCPDRPSSSCRARRRHGHQVQGAGRESISRPHRRGEEVLPGPAVTTTSKGPRTCTRTCAPTATTRRNWPDWHRRDGRRRPEAACARRQRPARSRRFRAARAADLQRPRVQRPAHTYVGNSHSIAARLLSTYSPCSASMPCARSRHCTWRRTRRVH